MNNGHCVEVGLADEMILVRDSKNPCGGVLRFTAAEWDAFIGGVRNGEFDRKRRHLQPGAGTGHPAAEVCPSIEPTGIPAMTTANTASSA